MARWTSVLRWLKRGLVGLLALLLLLAVVGYGLIKRASRPPAWIGPEIPLAARQAEEARLGALGLHLPPDGLLRAHPFEPPWDSRSLLVPRKWIRVGLPTLAGSDLRVQPGALLADLDVLQPVMERAYGGWDSAAARGWSWDGCFDRWRQALRSAGDRALPLDEAFAPIDALIAFQRDNHTQIPLQRFQTASPSQTVALAGPSSGSCSEVRMKDGSARRLDPRDPAQRTRHALAPKADGSGLEPVEYLSLPAAAGDPARIHCGEAWIALTGCSLRPKSLIAGALLEAGEQLLGGQRPTVERLTPEVVRIRLPTFVPELYARVEADRPGWPTPSGRETLLIVDLRGNGGGDAPLGYPVLRGWVDPKRFVPEEKLGKRVAQSCLYGGLKWNFAQLFLSGAELGPDDRKDLQEALDGLAAPVTPGCPRQVKQTLPEWSYPQHRVARAPGRPRILALVDEGCGSDCEGLLIGLASLPETVVVGTNTLGVAQFTQPGYSVLPHTRLPFRIALGQSNFYGDDRSFDGYGLDVDVLLRTGADWQTDRLVKLAGWLAR